jgi:hypothetical protein
MVQRMETVSCIHQLPIQQFQNVKLTFSHPDWSLDPFGYKCSINTRRQNYMIFQTKNHCSTKHHVRKSLHGGASCLLELVPQLTINR